MERSDAELVRVARQGDREAFRELVERYQRKIYAVLIGMLHEHDAAWETSQETFIRALKSLDQYKGDASFYTWLYRIAVNLAIDYQRREWRAPFVDASETALDEHEASADEQRRDRSGSPRERPRDRRARACRDRSIDPRPSRHHTFA